MTNEERAKILKENFDEFNATFARAYLTCLGLAAIVVAFLLVMMAVL